MIGFASGAMLDEIVTVAAPETHTGRKSRFCVIVPAFNEAAGIEAFHRRLSRVMDTLGTWQVLYVNDGSTDDTLDILRHLHDNDSHIALINLSRNFGKEIAMTAGLDHASAEAIIIIDSDLQDPPEVIPALVEAWCEGFDVVYAQRSARQGETWVKKTTANLFYRLMQDLGDVRLPRNTGDFRLLSWRVVESLRTLREGHRFMKGLFAWVGFPSKAILYERAPRHAGISKWNYWKLWNFAIEAITGFTVMPLKLAHLSRRRGFGVRWVLHPAIGGSDDPVRQSRRGLPQLDGRSAVSRRRAAFDPRRHRRISWPRFQRNQAASSLPYRKFPAPDVWLTRAASVGVASA